MLQVEPCTLICVIPDQVLGIESMGKGARLIVISLVGANRTLCPEFVCEPCALCPEFVCEPDCIAVL